MESLETPHVSYLYDCQPVKCAPNSNIIAQKLAMLLEILESTETSCTCYCLMLQKYDCCWYNAKISVSQAVSRDARSTCTFIAQLCYENRIHFEDVYQLIAKIKAVTIKNKTRQAKFSAIGYPPQPVPTKWRSWLNAAQYYAKNLPEVKAIAESFVGSGILVTQAKVSLQKSGLTGQQLKIKHQYECLVKLRETTESAKYTIKEAVQAIQELDFDEDTCNINQNIKKRIQNNDISEILNMEKQDILPAV